MHISSSCLQSSKFSTDQSRTGELDVSDVSRSDLDLELRDAEMDLLSAYSW